MNTHKKLKETHPRKTVIAKHNAKTIDETAWEPALSRQPVLRQYLATLY